MSMHDAFDEVTRILASPVPRRQAFRLVAGVVAASVATPWSRRAFAAAPPSPCNAVSITYTNQAELVCPQDLPCGTGIQFDIPSISVCPGDDCSGKRVTETATTDGLCSKPARPRAVVTGRGCNIGQGNNTLPGPDGNPCQDQYALCGTPALFTALTADHPNCTETYTQKLFVDGKLVQTCTIVFKITLANGACSATATRTCASEHSPDQCCFDAEGHEIFCAEHETCCGRKCCDTRKNCCVHPGVCTACDLSNHCCVPDPQHPGFRKCVATRRTPAPLGSQGTTTCGECCELTYRFSGGGKFLSGNGSVSLLRIDISGDTATSDPTAFADFSAVAGSLSAYNFVTRAQIDTPAFSAFEATLLGGGSFLVSAEGTARVNGIVTNIDVAAVKLGSTTSFEIRNADTDVLLAGGTGEAGRAAFDLTTSVV